ELALHRQFVHSPAKSFLRHGLGHTRQLEHHPSRLDRSDPPLRGSLTGTHPGLGGLLGQRTVREDVDPDLATTADVAGHRDTRRLDLMVGNIVGLESQDAVLAEVAAATALGTSPEAGVVLLAVLDLAGNEHRQLSSFPDFSALGASVAWAVAFSACCCWPPPPPPPPRRRRPGRSRR